MKKNRISKNWINKQKRDIYVRQSQLDGYRARSAYKLIEIDEKFKIFKNGISVIDLGASPGSWSQYISRTVKSGRLVSIDIKGMEEIENTIQIKGDFTDLESQEKIKGLFKSNVDVVVSDMAVNTTGNMPSPNSETKNKSLERMEGRDQQPPKVAMKTKKLSEL